MRLPVEVDPPRVTKADPDSSPVFTVSFNSTRFNRLEIVEMLDRIVVPRVQTIPGVGSIVVDGPRYAMRLWVDSNRLAAYGLTVTDVESALRRQNVEVPAAASNRFPVNSPFGSSET